MIKNIIFDLGRVLVQFEPRCYVNSLYGTGEKADHIFRAVFEGESWLDLDRGLIQEEQALEEMIREAPYPDEIRYILQHWSNMLEPIEATVSLVKRLKEQGYVLFILSNFHRRAFQNIYQKFSFFELFKGLIISSDTGLIKPDPAIYQHLFNTFRLNPKESLFIDDTYKNIVAAETLGMEGIVFQSAEQVKMELIHRKIL